MPTSATRLRVLIVEDEPLFAEQFEAALEQLGYQPVGQWLTPTLRGPCTARQSRT